MDDAAAGLATLIGTRVRGHRQALGWTLDTLAHAAGVSRRMVVSVEQGEVNPSVGILLRLAEALGVGLPSLVEPADPTPVTVTRSGDAAVLWTGADGGRGVLMAAIAAPDVVELWDWTLAGGDRHDSDAHADGTRELVHVLTGALTIEVADRCVRLGPGDSATFPADTPHSYANPGRRTARFSLTVYEPLKRSTR